MKNIFLIIGLIITVTLKAQTDASVDELPDAATPAGTATQWLYLLDGTTDKSFKLSNLYGVMDTKDNVVKAMLGDTATQLRSEITGGGAWSSTARYIYPTTLTDSVGINTNSPNYPLDVNGEARVSTTLYTPDIWLGTGPLASSGNIYGDGDNIMFQANNTTAVSLLSLLQGQFTLTGNTMYANASTRNWNFGGTVNTLYKMNVEGDFYANGDIGIPTNYKMYLGTSYIWEFPSTSNFMFFNIAGQDRAYLTTAGTYTGLLYCSFFQSSSSTDPASAATSEGIFYYNSVDKAMKVSNGTSWVEIGSGLTEHMADTLWFDYLDGSASGSRFIVLTSTGAADSGVLVNASEQLAMYLSPLKEYLNDTQDGELAGYYTKDGELTKNYGLKDNETGQSLGLQAIEILMGHAERSYRFIYRRVIIDNYQWILIGLLFLGFSYQQIQINKLRRK